MPPGQHSSRNRRLPKFIPEERWDGIIEAATVNRRWPALGTRDAAIIAFLLATGLREHELCKLNLHEVPAAGGSFRVVGKGNKERHVVIADCYVPQLQAYLRIRPRVEGPHGGPLFLSRKIGLDTGGRLDTSAIRRLVGRVEAHLQAEGIHPHAFRHSHLTRFVRLCKQQGLTLFEAAEQAGHDDLETLRLYYADDVAERQKIAALF